MHPPLLTCSAVALRRGYEGARPHTATTHFLPVQSGKTLHAPLVRSTPPLQSPSWRGVHLLRACPRSARRSAFQAEHTRTRSGVCLSAGLLPHVVRRHLTAGRCSAPAALRAGAADVAEAAARCRRRVCAWERISWRNTALAGLTTATSPPWRHTAACRPASACACGGLHAHGAHACPRCVGGSGASSADCWLRAADPHSLLT
jgi:hypothetical protein